MKKEHSTEEANQKQQPVENPQTDMLAELTNDLQRTRADFENFRKQVEIREQNARNMAKLSTIAKVLPLLDDIDRAISSYTELAPLKKSLDKTLSELNLKPIEAIPGQTEFNPDLHDAVSMDDKEGEKEIVAEVLRSGYYYENEVLRPAMVKVTHL